MFTWLTNLGAFGLVLLMALTSFAVVGYFRRSPHGHGTWTRTVAPAAAGIALTVLFGLIVANFEVLIGLEEASILGWLLPAIAVVPGLAGIAWALRLRTARPDVYAGIGGADAVPAESA